MYNALYTHFVSIYSLFDKNYVFCPMCLYCISHNVESDLCRIIFLYSFLPSHSLQSGCSLIEVISELYCSTQITLYCPPTHVLLLLKAHSHSCTLSISLDCCIHSFNIFDKYPLSCYPKL